MRSPFTRLVIFISVLAVMSSLGQQSVSDIASWDFEEGVFRGWSASGTFGTAPRRGDVPGLGAVGHIGQFWAASFENPSRSEFSSGSGTLVSAAFRVPPGRLGFLIAGNPNTRNRVELRVSRGGDWGIAYSHSPQSRTMQPVVWDLAPFAGQTGNIVVLDEGSGFIGVDQFFFSGIVPKVVGQPEAVALQTLARSGFRGRVAGQEASGSPAGTVLKQSANPGSTYGIGNVVSLITARAQLISVPNFTGMPERQAMDSGRVLGLAMSVVDRRASPRPVGEVLGQDVGAGAQVQPGMQVNLIVSSGSTAARVPNVIGLTVEDAASVASPAYTIVETGSEVSSGPPGIILRQTPPEGAPLPPRGRISVVVSRQAETLALVPSVLGMSQPDARRAIESAGLTYVVDRWIETANVPEGFVAGQSPREGDRVTSGSSVSVRLARGRPWYADLPPWLGPLVAIVVLVLVLGSVVRVLRWLWNLIFPSPPTPSPPQSTESTGPKPRPTPELSFSHRISAPETSVEPVRESVIEVRFIPGPIDSTVEENA